MELFFASSMFSQSDTNFNKFIQDVLSDVINVTLPQDGPILDDVLKKTNSRQDAERYIFNYDLQLIEKCDFFLICLDGLSVDEGAAFELGYAFSKGKTCLGYLSDWRKSGTQAWRNPMISVPLSRIFRDAQEMKAFFQFPPTEA